MKKFAVIPNIYKDPELKLTKSITDMLNKNGMQAVFFAEKVDSSTLSDFDCVVVLGGDGTILDVAKLAAVCNVPVAGVNLGKIGYLASVEQKDTEKLLLIDDNTKVDSRMMLTLEYRGKKYNAINDFLISAKRASKMISVTVSADGELSCDYNSTALIFSTPTGSSGYNVSAGGPVIDPTLECVAVTPVCPHTGTARSCIYKPDVVFTVQNVSSEDKEVTVSVDGGPEFNIEHNETVRIYKSSEYVKLIKFESEPFTKTMIRKMKI